ncbi:MAG: ferrous iron transport protein B [Anaerolineaceae bacterium]|nr:ferrous iron transport protein B [Anaerolineaceae bacterium]
MTIEQTLEPINVATKTQAQNCHSGPQTDLTGLPLVTIVGTPNVGKSVLFNILTGVYATVSNYPGTTVEITRGKGRFAQVEAGVMDTPGMYGLLPITEEERVARSILLHEKPDIVVHVLDAKNIERMLPMTLQLIEAGLPVFLVVNLMDEADRLGVLIDVDGLQHALGIPVVGTALAVGRGALKLKENLAGALIRARSTCCPTEKPAEYQIAYTAKIEAGLERLGQLIDPGYPISIRSMSLLLLQNDTEVARMIEDQQPKLYPAIQALIQDIQSGFNQPLPYVIARCQREAARLLLEQVLQAPAHHVSTLASRLSDWMIRPLTGLPMLMVALFVLYEFVGVFGAQKLVGLLEVNLFGNMINPWVNGWLAYLIPWGVVRDLLGGEFGVITLGIRYAVAIVLPIVGTFFLAFSVIEDSGYLPRLAMLIDRVFKRIGLNGRAVIPMVLGFGCDTMATIVTRTLETRRERLLATFLLSLAIPCSAQLGVMLALLNGHTGLLAIWAAIITGVFLLIGWLAAKLMPGERPTFYMELPPLRLPTLKNVLVKTYTRMEWYLREVFPLFIVASVIIWVGRLTGAFNLAVSALVPVVRFIGLPDATAKAFLFGFFRRDFGAAGLYDLRGSMTAAQLLIATTTMTLFMPCIAQLSVTIKERGWKTALAITAFIFPFALLVGGLLNVVLRIFRFSL